MVRATSFLYSLLYVVQGRLDDRKDRGATAVEYGLLVGLIAVVIITAVALLGTELVALFTKVTDKL